jgi:hypothetical protein
MSNTTVERWSAFMDGLFRRQQPHTELQRIMFGPDDPSLHFKVFRSLSKAIEHWLPKCITSLLEFKEIELDLMTLQPIVYKHPSSYHTMIKCAFELADIDPDMRSYINHKVNLTKKQKEYYTMIATKKIETKLQYPYQFKPDDVLEYIQNHKKTQNMFVMGILLELSLGIRSIDLLNEQIMTASVSQCGAFLMVRGHSKTRCEEEMLASKTERKVKPIGLTAIEAYDMLQEYRLLNQPMLDKIETTFAHELARRLPRRRLQFLTQKLAKIRNRKLNTTLQKTFPLHEPNARKLTTHVMRALHANLAYYLHNTDNLHIDLFMKRELCHSSFGSIVNYKSVELILK